MGAGLSPHAEHVVIRRVDTGFLVGTLSGAPQIESRSFEEAVRLAGGFAAREGVELWYISHDGTPHRLADVHAFRRFWNEFIELPGLRLTPDQARCLMAIDDNLSRSVLDSLVDLGFLTRTADGSYTRSMEPHRAVAPLRRRQPRSRQSPR